MLVDDDILKDITDLGERTQYYEKKINNIKEKPNQTEADVKKREGYEQVLNGVQKRLEEAKEKYANLPE